MFISISGPPLRTTSTTLVSRRHSAQAPVVTIALEEESQASMLRRQYNVRFTLCLLLYLVILSLSTPLALIVEDVIMELPQISPNITIITSSFEYGLTGLGIWSLSNNTLNLPPEVGYAPPVEISFNASVWSWVEDKSLSEFELDYSASLINLTFCRCPRFGTAAGQRVPRECHIYAVFLSDMLCTLSIGNAGPSSW